MTLEVLSLGERLLKIGIDKMNPPNAAISVTRRTEPLGVMMLVMYPWRRAI